MNIGTSESKPEVDPVKPGLYRISRRNSQDFNCSLTSGY
jgi:hypothetical protein